MRVLSQKLWKMTLLLAPLFYLRHLGKETYIYRLSPTTRLKMRVNSYDRLFVFEVWQLKEYEDEHFRIRAADVVIDISAQIGAFSLWAAGLATSGLVYAFEPNAENYRLLVEKKELNAFSNLHTFKQAVSARKGNARMYFSKFHTGSHSFFDSDAGHATMVPTTSLADVFEDNCISRVNYLKVDAEGAEYPIILNTPPAILERIDKIILEFHDYLDHGHNLRELERYLVDTGFEVSIDTNPFQRHVLKSGILKAIRI